MGCHREDHDRLIPKTARTTTGPSQHSIEGTMTSRIIVALAVAVLTATFASADDLYFPADGWETVKPSSVGWNSGKLAAAVQFAMSRKSSGIVILYRGRILAEEYQDLQNASTRYRRMVQGQDADGHPIEDVASAQKSVVSFLVGVAQEKGHVKITDPVHQHLGVGWSRAKPKQESAITIRHLMTMSSGLNDKLEFITRPGTKWKYNTSAYSQTLRTIAAASGKSPNELTGEWLTNHLGMKDSRWVERPGAKLNLAANPYGFATSARDLARFGLLMVAKGRWNDRTLLADQDYLKAALAPSQTMNPSYGFLWWLNGQESRVRGALRVKGPLIASAPPDLVGAFGALGRKCYVVPSLDLVVTRLGDSPTLVGKANFDREFWRLLMEAAPK
ncbi:MAG TPA: class C beta-lactamase-related serine hydrolase [Planctomycetaceae bacterium]|nr:class C beta-lactamase-related serine hydrolase [Planctomycetaceae bacterium]